MFYFQPKHQQFLFSSFFIIFFRKGNSSDWAHQKSVDHVTHSIKGVVWFKEWRSLEKMWMKLSVNKPKVVDDGIYVIPERDTEILP